MVHATYYYVLLLLLIGSDSRQIITTRNDKYTHIRPFDIFRDLRGVYVYLIILLS